MQSGPKAALIAKKKNKIGGEPHGGPGGEPRGLPPAPMPRVSGPALAAQERVCQLLEEWGQQQQAMHAEHQRLAEQLLLAQREALEEMRRSWPDGAPRGAPPASPVSPLGQRGAAGAAGEECEEPFMDNAVEFEASATACPTGRRMASRLGQFAQHDVMLDFWKRTHGMHTVDKWIMNYKEHPAGWGALLMIHGVQELTGRLRTKVENYAIYSALFLSMSIALLASPADFMFQPCEDDDSSCMIGKRVYVYGLSIGTALHMLCIMLAMAFVNSLNEAARDSDVYRLLATGGGYAATQKCSYCFNFGCASDFCAVLVSAGEYLNLVEPLVLYVALCVVGMVAYFITSRKLYGSCSIVSYWRKDQGGNPDADDPFDLEVPVRCVHERANMNKFVFQSGSPGSLA